MRKMLRTANEGDRADYNWERVGGKGEWRIAF